MFCRRYIKKIFSLVSVENHSKFCFPKMFFMRSLFRFPKLPYMLDFHVFFLVSQKSVMGNKASSLSTNRARSSFFKAFFLKLFFFLIIFCSSSGMEYLTPFLLASLQSKFVFPLFQLADIELQQDYMNYDVFL